jgi:hypothetical protein
VTDLQHRGQTMKMRATIRGERAELLWHDSTLTGEPTLVKRTLMEARRNSVDLTDPAAALRCLENVLGSRPEVELGPTVE